MCPRALWDYICTYITCLHAFMCCVLTCICTFVFYVPTCLLFYVPTWWPTFAKLRTYVATYLCFFTSLRVYVSLCYECLCAFLLLVPTCLCTLFLCIPLCWHAFVFFTRTLLRVYVNTCLRAYLRAYVPELSSLSLCWISVEIAKLFQKMQVSSIILLSKHPNYFERIRNRVTYF